MRQNGQRSNVRFMKTGGRVNKKNGSKINDFEELGRVDSEKAYTSKGKKDLKAEKKRIVKKLNAQL